MTYLNPGIEFDRSTFDPLKIMPVRHQLVDHPLLQLGSLIDLAKRLDRRGAVRAHNDDARPDTSFKSAPETHPVHSSVEDTIKNIERSKAWMALHNVQTDPIYRGLVDEVLDYVQPMIEDRDPGMCHRAGWIFVTSPNAVTPYHLDHEHNFIVQIHGTKTINVFDATDRDIVSERALELWHAKISRNLVTYSDPLQCKARVFEAHPGMGAYMPATSPHWVKNGDNVSVTVSFTYYTRLTYRMKAAYRANHALRALGLSPRPVGVSAVRDVTKGVLFDAQERLRLRLRSTPRHPSLSLEAYADDFGSAAPPA